MKKYLLFFGLGFSLSGNLMSQVQINVLPANQELSADLQLDATDKGVLLPRVALTNTTVDLPVTSPKEGILVYNTATAGDVSPGYYYWKLSPSPHWESVGLNTKNTIIQLVNQDILGYNPTASGSSAANTITIGSNTASKQRCLKWQKTNGGNNHTYCSYTLNNGINFPQAFNFAQGQNGYVLTVTSQSEWEFVLNNIINDGGSLGGTTLSNNIWLGYIKVRRPGNNSYVNKYEFITGEVWDVFWSNDADAQSQFATGQPIDASADNNNRCTYISNFAGRLWSSSSCSTTASFTNLIIEFTN